MPRGRPKGAINMTTRMVQDFCRRVVGDPEYQKNFLERARNGTLGQMESVCWAYAFGKPKEQLDVHVTGDNEYDTMTPRQIEERLRELLDRVKEARSTRQAIELVEAKGDFTVQ